MQPKRNQSKTLALIRLLERIAAGEDLRLVGGEVGKIVGAVGAGEILAAQDHLRQSGYSDGMVAQLLAAFTLMGAYVQRKNQAIGEVTAPHILQMATAEHAMFRSLATQLERVLADLRAVEHLSDTSVEFRRLAHVVHHLKALNEHFDREEDVILPYLRRQSWAGLCRAVAADHARLRTYIDQLTALIDTMSELPPEEFRSYVAAVIDGFCSCLREHLSFEDGLLWPLALVVLDDPATWETITALSDEIGYCGIHA